MQNVAKVFYLSIYLSIDPSIHLITYQATSLYLFISLFISSTWTLGNMHAQLHRSSKEKPYGNT